jgi:hypothetical protein
MLPDLVVSDGSYLKIGHALTGSLSSTAVSLGLRKKDHYRDTCA